VRRGEWFIRDKGCNKRRLSDYLLTNLPYHGKNGGKPSGGRGREENNTRGRKNRPMKKGLRIAEGGGA